MASESRRDVVAEPSSWTETSEIQVQRVRYLAVRCTELHAGNTLQFYPRSSAADRTMFSLANSSRNTSGRPVTDSTEVSLLNLLYNLLRKMMVRRGHAVLLPALDRIFDNKKILAIL